MTHKAKYSKLRKSRVSNDKVELSCGNVFADLGFRDAEERLLKAKLATSVAQLKEQKRSDDVHKH